MELVSTGIGRLDAVLLSVMTTPVIVGYYGAAYRLLEATLFIPVALQGALAAMYTYLDEKSPPSINAVFQRSIKWTVVLLMPAAVAFATLPGPLIRILFGSGFGPSAEALRLLGPTVVLLGVVLLSTSLVNSRLNPRILLTYFGIALLVNLALNLALIPMLGATGAAAAMLATELVLATLNIRLSVREVGPLPVVTVLGGPLIAAASMATVIAALHTMPGAALALGIVVYVAALAAAERRIAPADYAFMTGHVRRRLPGVLDARRPDPRLPS